MGANVTYRKRDLETAIAVAVEAGFDVTGTEIDRDGTIRLLFGDLAVKQTPEPETDNLRDRINAETSQAS